MPNATKSTETPNDKVTQAMKLVNEARAEKVDQTRQQINESMEKTKDAIDSYRKKATEFMNSSVQSTEEKIQKSPFQFLAGATIIGLLLGFLFGRKK